MQFLSLFPEKLLLVVCDFSRTQSMFLVLFLSVTNLFFLRILLEIFMSAAKVKGDRYLKPESIRQNVVFILFINIIYKYNSIFYLLNIYFGFGQFFTNIMKRMDDTAPS